MLRKAMLLGCSAVASVAMLVPGGASAEWKEKGKKLTANAAVSFSGNTAFVGEIGGINCTESFATAVLEPGINGKITSFGATNNTTKCTASGVLAACSVHSVTATNLNWAIGTTTASISIIDMHFDTTLTGLFCPYHELTLRGSVGATPNNLTEVSKVELFGNVSLRNTKGGAVIGNVQVQGTWAIAPAGVYGVKEALRMSVGSPDRIELHPIGRVESGLTDPAQAPKQGDEGAPEVTLALDEEFAAGLRDLRPGKEIVVLTWLDRARRDVLAVHPRDDPANPLTGVFSTRSADRPNPIGLHRVEILAIDGTRLRVRNLEAVDGTPILDLKPVLGPAGDR